MLSRRTGPGGLERDGSHRAAPDAHRERTSSGAAGPEAGSLLVGEEAGAFVCDYHLPEPKDLDRRRQVLQACGGGRLGVVDAVELVIETRDIDAARRRWQRLLDPLQPREPLSWHLPVGPAVTLTGGEDERVGDLVLAVTSPPEAAAVWRAVASPLRQLPLRFTQARGRPKSAGGAVSGPSA